MLGALVAADVDDVPIAPVGDHAGDGTIVLQYGIRGDRSAMQDMIDALARDAVRVLDALKGAGIAAPVPLQSLQIQRSPRPPKPESKMPIGLREYVCKAGFYCPTSLAFTISVTSSAGG